MPELQSEAGKLVILVATMTGAAEMLAEDLQAELGGPEKVELRLLENAVAADFPTTGLALVVSSTYGTGDVPETAERALASLLAEKPELRALRFGVISLGDSHYGDTFAKGGLHWDDALRQCGARRVGEILKIDCQTGDDPAEVARPWLADWLAIAVGADADMASGKARTDIAR
ncbi:MAG: flavodoxin domain-containing protein [Alphaproteobacteria bacterium]|nr:flavodoxin domain-containing protein [Alphaproteobacteria bacterium]